MLVPITSGSTKNIHSNRTNSCHVNKAIQVLRYRTNLVPLCAAFASLSPHVRTTLQEPRFHFGCHGSPVTITHCSDTCGHHNSKAHLFYTGVASRLFRRLIVDSTVPAVKHDGNTQPLTPLYANKLF